jgi:hypothetical protein
MAGGIHGGPTGHRELDSRARQRQGVIVGAMAGERGKERMQETQMARGGGLANMSSDGICFPSQPSGLG